VWARAAGAGDRGALTALVPLLYRDARRYLRARLWDADEDEIEDLASAGVVKAVGRLHTARAASNRQFFAWHHAVVWRTTLDARRHRARRDVSGGALSLDTPCDASVPGVSWGERAAIARWGHLEAEPPGGGSVEGDGDGARSPARIVAQLAAEAQRALAPGADLVLWSALVAGDAWAEVAVRVGTTPGGAKRRFQRALARLRASVWEAAGALPEQDRVRVLAWLRTVTADTDERIG
jgi:DNA-directed RNA polymerase specialized sigma24 family protein